jgi:hypothetical protein
LLVNMAAAAAGWSATAHARSGFPLAFKPARTAAKEKPRGI